MIGEHVYRLHPQVSLAVLYMPTVIACVLVFLLLHILLHQFVIVLDGVLALLSCLLVFLVGSLCHLHTCLEQGKLIALGTIHISHLPADGSPLAVAVPELGIIAYDGTDVPDGTLVVAYIIEQKCAVIERNGIVGLYLEYKVEVLNGQIVLPHACPEQSTVEVSEIVVGLDVQRSVIIRHGTPQVVLIIACQSTVDIESGHLGHLHQRLVERGFCLGVFMPCSLEHGLHAPRLTLILVELKRPIHPLLCPHAVVAGQCHLGFESILAGFLGPVPDHLVQ